MGGYRFGSWQAWFSRSELISEISKHTKISNKNEKRKNLDELNLQTHIAVVLGSNVFFGGGYQYALSVLKAITWLPADRYKITVVASNKEWRNHLQETNVELRNWRESYLESLARKGFYNLPGGIGLWRQVSKWTHSLYRCLKSVNPDVVVFPSEAHFSLGWLGRTIAPIHDLMHRYEKRFPEVGNLYTQIRRDRLYARMCRYCDAILVDSELGKKQLVESYGIPPSRVQVLPYSTPPYLPAITNSYQIRENYNLPERFLFYPAQLWQHKNHVGLLKALVLLRQEGTMVNAVFCGADKNAGGEIFDFIRSHELQNQVFYLNYVSNEETVELYRAAVALVMPTYFGPTNIPPLEAFELGCPVAVSNVYAMAEQVGEAAILFDPNNSDEIAEKIRLLWTNEKLRQDLIEKGYKKAASWSRAKFAERLLEIIQEVVKHN